MSVEDLEIEVRVLRGCYGSLADDQARLKETNAFLEQRMRSLEQRLLGHPEQPQACSAPVLLETPVTVRGDVLPEASVAPEHRDTGCSLGKEAMPEAQGAQHAEVEPGPEAAAFMVEHDLGETIWDAVVFVGLPELTRGGSLILLATMLLNAAVQAYICVVLLMSEDFMQRRRFRDLGGPMHEFRVNTGHDSQEVDSKGRSLTARICHDDQTLALGFRQADVLAEINAYLGMEPEDLTREHFGTGPLLCGVCVFLFAASVLRELRGVASSTWAVCAVPPGPVTALEGGRLVALSRVRFACIMANNVVRAGIAAMLLVTGVMWLCGTSSITDLILNAAALCFVMDLDECLFEMAVPSSVHMFVKGLEALRYRRWGWNMEAIVPLVAVCAISIAAFPLFVNPNTLDMLQVKQVLCSGNQNFMVKTNGAGLVVSTKTMDFLSATAPSLLGRAVEELTFNTQLGQVAPQFSYYTETASTYDTNVVQTLEAFANQYDCSADADRVFGGLFLTMIPYVFTAVRYATGLHAGETLLERPFACTDYAAFCQEVPLVRAVCHRVCGCDDPLSGLLIARPGRGCPSACALGRRQRLTSARPCADMSVANSSVWRSYWTALKDKWTRDTNNATHAREIRAVTRRKIADGCSNDEPLPVVNVTDCDDRHMVLSAHGFSSVAAFCAGRCCRGADPPSECPSSCSASAAGSSR